MMTLLGDEAPFTQVARVALQECTLKLVNTATDSFHTNDSWTLPLSGAIVLLIVAMVWSKKKREAKKEVKLCHEGYTPLQDA
jgi:hypothetical protein